MKMNIAAAALALVLLPGLAIADSDLSDWSGFYAGAGWSFGSSQEEIDSNYGTINGVSQDVGGAEVSFGNVLAGYLVDNGAFVYGGQVELFLGGSSNFGPSGTCGFGSICVESGMVGSLDPTARISAIVGTEIQPGTLFFGSLGVVHAEATYRGIFGRSFVTGASATATALLGTPQVEDLLGLSIGVGVEHRINQNWSLRVGGNYDFYREMDIVSAFGIGTGAGDGTDSASTGSFVTDSIGFDNFSLNVNIIFRF